VALVGCGGRSVVGTATVSVYSNGAPGSDATIPPMPIAGIAVFEDGGAPVLTDADGNAVVSLTSEHATVHVVGADSVTTIVDVPVGGVVRLGRSLSSATVGVVNVTMPDVGASSYGVYGPAGCTSFVPPRATPQLSGEYRGFCGGKVVRLFGEAVTTSGVKIAQVDAPLTQPSNVMIPSYVDAVFYAGLFGTNEPLPTDATAVVGVVDPSTRIPVLLPDMHGPDAGLDLVRLASSDSTLWIHEPLTPMTNFDATHFMPVADVTHADSRHLAWSFERGTSQPNLVAVTVRTSQTVWTVYGPATLTSVTFPDLPDGVTTTLPDAGASVSGEVDYYEEPRPVLTPDELNSGWSTLVGFDAMAIASSRATF
jgi:hypothetical protein